MSYPYRVRVAASISAPIRSRQESRRTITLELPLVPKERLREKLLEQLRRDGFATDADGTLVRTRGDAVERVDPQTLVATAAIESEGTIQGADESSAAAPRGRAKAVERELRARMEERLLRDGTGRFERELSVRVDEAGRALERDHNEAIATVYVEAMEERARKLGEVESVRRERVGSEVVLEIKVTVAD